MPRAKKKPPTAAELRAENKKLRAELEAAKLRNPPAAAPPKALEDLEPPPTDSLEANAYAHRVMMLSLYDAARDATISAKDRRKELRTIASAAAKLTPTTKIWEAVKFIKADRAELDAKKAERGAKLEPRPRRTPPAAVVLPFPDPDGRST